MSKKEKEVINIKAKDETKEILDQIKQIKMIMLLDHLKEMNNEDKINHLHKIGLSKENIVELVLSLNKKETMNLAKKMKNYEKFGILKKEGYSNKQIAKLFDTTENNVKSTLSQYKN